MRKSVICALHCLVLLTFLLSRPGVAEAVEATLPDSLLAALPASAQMSALIEDDAPQFEAKLLVSIDPTSRVGVLIDLAPGWHLYWRNPGETGIAPDLDLAVTGHRVGALRWPSPRTFREADGLFTTYGYEDQVLLMAPFEAIDSDTAPNQSIARVEASVLVCRTQCVPVSFTLSTAFDADLPESQQAHVDSLFHDFDTQVPHAAADLGLVVEAYWTGEEGDSEAARPLALRIYGCGHDEQECLIRPAIGGQSLFIPMEENGFEFSDADLVSGGSSPEISTITMNATRLEADAERLHGLVTLRDRDGRTRHVEVDLPILAKLTRASAPTPVLPTSALRIFLFALLGGLILNCMPCVLPILAIKVVAVASMAEKNVRQIRLHGLAYTGGVLGSMALLSVAVTGLRAAGHFVGWGFQFQEPLFVAVISALLVAFAMNLFGVFEIELGQGRLADLGQDTAGYPKSAFEGFIAVVLATPCTAPFLGTAVGFAFASSALASATIFLAIGLGLASPFLLISFFPSLAQLVPRPGAWMIKLRTALGFGLLATVIWLLWVIGQGAGPDSVIAMAASLLFLAFLLWILGQTQPLRNLWLARASVVTIVLISFGSFNLIDFDPISASADEATKGHQASAIASGRQIYSSQAVTRALAAGQPAFVIFTADWCITCQLNEHAVLRRKTVQDAFRARDVAIFEADWTRRDDAIRVKLAEFGRAGVPLYLFYSPDAPDEPEILSELLSQREVIAMVAGHRSAARG